MARAASAGAIGAVRIPPLLYGTAWKEGGTARLTRAALQAGFRGIDTANQRRHYFEAAVGEAVQEAIRGGLPRDDLFLQTKFTHVAGQDQRLPYDPKAPVAKQVEQSFQSSLEHLGVEALDAYLLHGPSSYPGLGPADWEAWRAMEDLQGSGRVRAIGVSNVTASQLEELLADASVQPMLVQNRTFTRPQADEAVRILCRRHGIIYEGFSLLTAIRPLLAQGPVASIAARLSVEPAQVVFAYCLAAGLVVLTGTTSEAHMRADLRAPALDRAPEDLEALDALLGLGAARAPTA